MTKLADDLKKQWHLFCLVCGTCCRIHSCNALTTFPRDENSKLELTHAIFHCSECGKYWKVERTLVMLDDG